MGVTLDSRRRPMPRGISQPSMTFCDQIQISRESQRPPFAATPSMSPLNRSAGWMPKSGTATSRTSYTTHGAPRLQNCIRTHSIATSLTFNPKIPEDVHSSRCRRSLARCHKRAVLLQIGSEILRNEAEMDRKRGDIAKWCQIARQRRFRLLTLSDRD